MRSKILFTAVSAAFLLSASAYAAGTGKSCLASECRAGSKAVTYATKAEPYYACPTRELATYSNFVLGLLAMHVSLGGGMPNISDKTGEPEYLDVGGKPNETRLILTSLRQKAGVTTFDQAVARCAQGRNGTRVVVMNNPQDETVIWVVDESKKAAFWMPKAHLDSR
ncbi:hypothetical protein BKK79_19885 [Cupriavidus sp. USMAA2-4]|uniref:hypothetical protein n=1 Tax=Cupriavidus sp. USMAA2-4 TaxID=876364 RepID=UPI0008A68FF7|nr:hypothetical protein [Cupriavidus sp. USMAA2-4]AOY93808.1 hypothetical protein BKK79_19885 [Cupriavidus sp. USMAA2-4]